MDKFIKTVEVFDEKTCQSIIDLFEASNAKERIDNGGLPTFTQVNLNVLAEKGYQKFTQLLCYKVLEIVKEYKKDLPQYTEWFPEKIFFEELRISKTVFGEVLSIKNLSPNIFEA